MTQQIESTLYIDRQAQIPGGYCPRCGGELYAPSFTCLRCDGEAP